MAAVRVVLPWSTWPMVPTLTCGLVRSNLPFAIFSPSEKNLSDQKLVPLAGIGPATSPLPRECSTTEPQGRILCPIRDNHIVCRHATTCGAGGGNRTRVISLEG